MIRNAIPPIILVLGASLLCAQVPGNDTGQGTTTTKSTGIGSGTSAPGAPKKIEPGSLEDLIDKALKNNADIRAAEAKVREAEAELNRVRHQIVAKVATLKHDIATAKKMLEFAEKQAGLVSDAYRKGAGSQQELHAALATVEKQKADVARLETEMQSLTGAWKSMISGAAFTPDGKRFITTVGTIRVWDADTGREIVPGETVWSPKRLSSVQTPMAERIKAALDKTVKIDQVKPEMPLGEAISLLVQKAGVDVPFRPIGKLDMEKVMMAQGELPLGAWLQALEDSALEDSAEVRFVVRDYGILITTANRMPEGAITVQEFWKRGDKPMGEIPKTQGEPKGISPKK